VLSFEEKLTFKKATQENFIISEAYCQVAVFLSNNGCEKDPDAAWLNRRVRDVMVACEPSRIFAKLRKIKNFASIVKLCFTMNQVKEFEHLFEMSIKQKSQIAFRQGSSPCGRIN